MPRTLPIGGPGTGYLHEAKDQTGAMERIAATCLHPTTHQEIADEIAHAFTFFAGVRPRPVHVEIPLDLLEERGDATISITPATQPSTPHSAEIAAVADVLVGAERVFIAAGGGSIGATSSVVALAELLGAAGFWAAVFGLAAAWAYSAPPLRLKQNGWWGNAACGFSYEGLAWITGGAVMLGGAYTRQEMIESVKRGLYAVNFGGGQVDITNGKFVFSASEAYMIENGRLSYPVKGATLIGNGPDALTRVAMVGNDLALDSGVGTCGKEGQSVPVGVGQPTLRIGDVGPMGRILVAGEPGSQIIEALAPQAGEWVIDKPGKGMFYNTGLHERLQTAEISHLIFMGVTTEVCVQTSMREANDRGYECLLLEDCTESYFPEYKQATLDMVRAQGAIVGWTTHSAHLLQDLGGMK